MATPMSAEDLKALRVVDLRKLLSENSLPTGGELFTLLRYVSCFPQDRGR